MKVLLYSGVVIIIVVLIFLFLFITEYKNLKKPITIYTPTEAFYKIMQQYEDNNTKGTK